jgi:hypothetical protein
LRSERRSRAVTNLKRHVRLGTQSLPSLGDRRLSPNLNSQLQLRGEGESSHEYRGRPYRGAIAEQYQTGRVLSGDPRRRHGIDNCCLDLCRARPARGSDRTQIHRRIVSEHRLSAQQEYYSRGQGCVVPSAKRGIWHRQGGFQDRHVCRARPQTENGVRLERHVSTSRRERN